MAITHYEPWTSMNDFHNEISRLFGSRRINGNPGNDVTNVVTSDWTPAVDVREEESQFTILVDIPGVESKEIEISMEKGVLSIKGERHSESAQEDKGYKRVERAHGTFYRSFSLPESADANGITAKSNNGVLEITIPKQAHTQPRKITVEG